MNAASAVPTVRRLGPADVLAYRELMLEAYGQATDAFVSSLDERAALPLDWWERRLDPGPEPEELVFGAWQGEALVGLVGLGFLMRQKERHKAHLFGMYVRPAQRRQGQGRALVAAALQAARARTGLRQITLSVTEGNQAAEALYAAFGFQRYGVEPLALNHQGRDMGMVHMACVLEPLRAPTPAAATKN